MLFLLSLTIFVFYILFDHDGLFFDFADLGDHPGDEGFVFNGPQVDADAVKAERIAALAFMAAMAPSVMTQRCRNGRPVRQLQEGEDVLPQLKGRRGRIFKGLFDDGCRSGVSLGRRTDRMTLSKAAASSAMPSR